MNKNRTIITFIAVVITLLCIGSIAALTTYFQGVQKAKNSMKSTAEVQEAAQQIATLDLPAGYQVSNGFYDLGAQMVVYKRSGSDVFFLLMQIPKTGELTGSLIAQMEKLFDYDNGQYFHKAYGVHEVSQKDMTIRGKPGQEVISEGTFEDTPVRQLAVYFVGKHGLAALFVVGPKKAWDGAAYDAMIRSIR